MMSITINKQILESPKVKLILTILYLGVWSLLMTLTDVVDYRFLGKASSIMLISVFLLLIIRSLLAKNIVLLVLSIFFFLYTLPPWELFFNGIYVSYHQIQYGFDYLATFQTCMIFSLFGFFLFYTIKILPQSKFKKIPNSSNDLLFYSMYIFTALLSLYNLATTQSIFSGSGYGSEDVTNHTALGEYILLIVLNLFIFAYNRKFKRMLIDVLLVIITIQTILIGGRITMVMMLLLALFVHYQYVISYKKLTCFFVLALLALTTFARIRANPLMLFSSNWYEIIFPFISENTSATAALRSNEGDVFWASERIIRIINEGILTFSERVSVFVEFLGSIVFIPVGENPMSSYRTNLYSTGGGGLLPIYSYVFASYPGVIAVGIFIGKIFNKLYSDNLIWFIYATVVLMTTPRWFAYYPIQLFKMAVYGVIIYLIVRSVNYSMKKIRK